jgi:hypothetical protein
VVSSSLDIQAPEARFTDGSAVMAGILANRSHHDSSENFPAGLGGRMMGKNLSLGHGS